MPTPPRRDEIPDVIRFAADAAGRYLDGIDDRPARDPDASEVALRFGGDLPEEGVGAVWDGMRGSTYDSAVVVAVCANGRLVGLAPIERLVAAPADAVMADVMDSDPPVVARARIRSAPLG